MWNHLLPLTLKKDRMSEMMILCPNKFFYLINSVTYVNKLLFLCLKIQMIMGQIQNIYMKTESYSMMD